MAKIQSNDRFGFNEYSSHPLNAERIRNLPAISIDTVKSPPFLLFCIHLKEIYIILMK